MTDTPNVAVTGGPYPGYEALYQKVLLISRARLCEMFSQTVAQTDKMLHEICQHEQLTVAAINLENYKLFRSACSTLEANFKSAIETCFAEYKNKKSTDALNLQLIDMSEMENVVTTELIAEALLRKYITHITSTNQRFCILLGMNEAESNKTPLTEKNLIEFLRTALQKLELPTKVSALLYRNYEAVLLEGLPELFAVVNEPMIAAGILPHLQNQNSVTKSQHKPVHQRTEESVISSQRTASNSQPQEAFKDNQVEHRHSSQWSSSDLPSSLTDHVLFDELCHHLHSWRPQHQQYSNASVTAQQPSQNVQHTSARRSLATHEMISMLSMLQASLPDSIASSMQGTASSISKMLKSEMENSAQKLGIPINSYVINRDDEDAVDLVGMLFDVLASERDFRDDAKAMLSRLVVPYTKAAVLDKRLFLTKAHPARKLLNALTEAVEGNKGIGPQDRDLLNKAESTVDRLVADFNEDIAIFELLEQEMRGHMDQHKHRINLAEKRAKEAQRGQERLENARMLSARELEAITKDIQLPEVIQEFFVRYWTHHLSMISLRDGEDSVAWSSAIHLAKDIIAILNSVPTEARYDRILSKRIQLESVFSSSGILADASKSIIHNIAEAASTYQIRKPTNQNDSVAFDSNQSTLSESALHLVFNKDALDYEHEDVAYFKGLEIGSWLQMEDSKGSFSPIKLAWVSPISSRLMFVNRRGVRVLVVSVEELAQMKKQSKLIVHDKENVFDQSLDRVLDRLKSDLA